MTSASDPARESRTRAHTVQRSPFVTVGMAVIVDPTRGDDGAFPGWEGVPWALPG